MNGIFARKSPEDRELEKQQKQAQMHHLRSEAAREYDDMVTKALERLTRWAFPDSQVERPEDGKWQLWHLTEEGKKYVDVSVTLQFHKDKPKSFLCDESLGLQIAKLTREDLDDALRMCISSISM